MARKKKVTPKVPPPAPEGEAMISEYINEQTGIEDIEERPESEAL